MEKITLTPGEWTRIWSTTFQVAGPYAVRIGLGSRPDNLTVTAPAADAPYFKTQDYDPNIVNMRDFGLDGLSAVYLMPHGSQPVDVVLLP